MVELNEGRLRGALVAYTETGIEEFRRSIDYVDIPLQTYALFMFLPLSGDISMAQITKLFNTLSQASVSRNVDILAGTSRLRTGGGYQLVERFEDIHDRRNKRVRLTAMGRNLRDTMHQKGLHRFNQIMGIGDQNA